jgi:hypothetical protein
MTPVTSAIPLTQTRLSDSIAFGSYVERETGRYLCALILDGDVRPSVYSLQEIKRAALFLNRYERAEECPPAIRISNFSINVSPYSRTRAQK